MADDPLTLKMPFGFRTSCKKIFWAAVTFQPPFTNPKARSGFKAAVPALPVDPRTYWSDRSFSGLPLPSMRTPA